MHKTELLLLISSLTLGAQAIVQHSVAAAAGTVAGTVAGKKISDSLNGVSKVTDAAAGGGTERRAQSSSKQNNQKQAKATQEEKAPAAAGAAKPADGKDSAGQKNSASSGGAQNTTTSQEPARAAKAGPRAPAPISKADAKTPAGSDPGVSATSENAPRVVARKPASRRNSRPKPKVVIAEAPVVIPAVVAAPPPEEPIKDITEIPVGTSRQSLLSKLGRPASRVSLPEDDGLKEIFTYARNGYGWGTVRLKNGVVIEVERRQ